MEATNQIPVEISAIIENKNKALLEEAQREREQKQRAYEEAELQGQIKVNEWISQVVLQVPEWIRPYIKMEDRPYDYSRIANGWDRVENINLYFHIPGLSQIQFDPKKNQWRAAEARQGTAPSYGEDGSEPYMGFHDAYWKSDLEYVLVRAKAEYLDYQGCVDLFASWKIDAQQRAAQYLEEEKRREEREAEADLWNEVQHKQEQAEEEALFNAIKNDPIAIHMLKAFVLLRDERSTFEQQLYEADESMSSIESRWSRRAEELRRQADDAQRRADDEKARIQSDLDDAEDKLKKVQRGW